MALIRNAQIFLEVNNAPVGTFIIVSNGLMYRRISEDYWYNFAQGGFTTSHPIVLNDVLGFTLNLGITAWTS